MNTIVLLYKDCEERAFCLASKIIKLEKNKKKNLNAFKFEKVGTNLLESTTSCFILLRGSIMILNLLLLVEIILTRTPDLLNSSIHLLRQKRNLSPAARLL